MVELAKIRSFCHAVAKQFRPRQIILFGSYAYGRPTADSDVDLLVIMLRTRDRGERMSVRIRHAVPRDFPLDLLVRTPSELAKRLRWGDGFVQEILAKGKIMYEPRKGSLTTKERIDRRESMNCMYQPRHPPGVSSAVFNLLSLCSL